MSNSYIRKKEAADFSETSVTRRHIPEHSNVHIRRQLGEHISIDCWLSNGAVGSLSATASLSMRGASYVVPIQCCKTEPSKFQR